MTSTARRSQSRERVSEVVSDIPPGHVMSYGDIAALVGTGARMVGRLMATSEAGLPWWRVTRADGSLPAELQDEALERYAAEGTPVRGGRADIRAARWNPWDDAR